MNKKLLILVILTCFLFSNITVSSTQNKKIEPFEKISSNNELNISLMLENLTEKMFFDYVEELVSISEKYEEARFTGTEGCIEARNYIINEFSSMGMNVRSSAWTSYGTFFPYNLLEFSSYNIEARLKGTSNSNKYYLISAHYDTVLNTPSADDNSAGVAAVLSTAKILSQYNFNHEIRFICWSGEEQGLLGSNAFAYEKYENNENLIATINLDMIGYTSNDIENDEHKVMVYETCSNRLIGTTIEVSENPEYSSFINLEVIPSEDDTGHKSDQGSFCRYSHDAIFIHEYTWNDQKDTSRDTIDNIDINYATRIARLAMGTIATWASSSVISNSPPEKPQSPKGPEFIKINEPQTFTSSTIDYDNDQIYYLFDWGDGTHSGWIGPIKSDEIVHASHTWNKQGEYKIRVKAKDQNGINSGWSESPKIIDNEYLFSRNFPVIKNILYYLFEY